MQAKKNIPLTTEIPPLQAMACDLCGSQALSPIYRVPDSAIGVIVAICSHCGLVQSFPTKPKPSQKIVSTSSGAVWGNIRHGKGLRLKAAIRVLETFVLKDEIRNVLDIGANRGHFVQWIHARKPAAYIVGVEPDYAIVEEYRKLPNLTLYNNRFENLDLPRDYFDLVYCSHTLEHANSASAMLQQIVECMKMGGHLFLEVPNIDVLTTKDIVEEFFIDKHRFHFNPTLLCTYLENIGFRVVYGKNSNDLFNITLLLIKESNKKTRGVFSVTNCNVAGYNKRIISDYIDKLRSNRDNLRRLVQKRLHPFIARQKVAFWGAGRLFDALVRYGGLKVDGVHCVVDEYLWNIVNAVHGIEVCRPEYLKVAQPQVLIVLARSSADEIVLKARRLGIKNVIKFSDLLQAL